MVIRSYRDLEVWKKSIQWIKQLYLLSRQFPKEETYGLTSQLRRSAVSVAANIAEGRNRGTKKEFQHFLNVAYGSLAEAETHIIIAVALDYITQKDAQSVLDVASEIGRMINGLYRSLTPDTRHLTPDTSELTA